MKTKPIEGFFSAADLESIAGIIHGVERQTRGEIRVSIVNKRSWRERKLTPHQLAVREFHRLGMQRTKDRTGILLLILPRERVFQILADEGIHSKVKGNPWEEIAGAMGTEFGNGRYLEGIRSAIEKMGEILREHVPQRPGDSNELPDNVEVRG